jgi:hypothetical protein
MRIYQTKDLYKRSTFCRLCGREGHMWFTCEMPTSFLTALEKNGNLSIGVKNTMENWWRETT